MVLKTNIIRIGNSKGVRIPKLVLEACKLKGAVNLEVKNGSLIISPLKRPRQGWAEAFRRMAAAGDDKLLDAGSLPATEFDKNEWEW
jgi:antitoxin MazE